MMVLSVAGYLAVRHYQSFPTRYEPGGRLDIPLRNEPGGCLGRANGWLKVSPRAWRVDHPMDGDRHERSAGTVRGADAPSAGRNAGLGVSPGRGRSGALCLDWRGAATN